VASQLIFGSFAFEENEANLVGVSKRTQYSQRNKKLQLVREWNVEGEINAATPAAIIARIQAIENALAVDGGQATYSIDGAVAHQLTANSTSGVRVAYSAFPKGDAAELCTTRTFAFKLRAVYDAQTEAGGDDLVFFQESISTEGDGSPLVIVVTEYPGVQTVGGLSAVELAPRTAVYYTQTGTAVGYSTYPVAPPPFNPDGLFGYLTRITRIGGRQVGNGIRFFTTKWFYRMGRDVAIFGTLDPIPTSK